MEYFTIVSISSYLGLFAADVSELFECSCSCRCHWGSCSVTDSSCVYRGDLCDLCSQECPICREQTTLCQISPPTCPPCQYSSTSPINCTGSTSEIIYATNTACPPCPTPNKSTVYIGSTAEASTTVCPPCPCTSSAGKYTGSTAESFTKDADSVQSAEEISRGNAFSAGVVVGALFGGLVLGFIITSSVFIYFWQRARKEQEKKNNLLQNYNHNPAYENGDYDQMNTRNKTQKPTKVSHVNPIPREESISTSNFTEDGVYNHLNESVKATTNTDDVYDHARPHSSTSLHCEGYGTLVFDHEGNDVYMEGYRDKGAGCSVRMDTKNEHTDHNYFVLEKETI
ncbi:uncharacterized protein LOC134254589 [Saccostrea cucullata]|uniref:uncharacterized protein LOC134254589 n=1 Tax=Saccostrea cuccullata TaxID=36930 RepID=UPI002ED5BE6C